MPLASPLAEALSDRYVVGRELGRGGMATVYLAEDLKHARKVAIKVLHPEFSAVLGGDRFLAEIRLTASLNHPHILGLLDSGVADRHLYYVMPYVAGESLRQRLEREKQLPISEVARIVGQIADAIDYAHETGVIHRDLKPENILLQEGHALVADFGIALAIQQAGGSRLTETGLSLGTPQYMSPEQATGERTVTGRSDVYALGVLAYELLTGSPPFTASTTQGVLAKIMTEEPKRPSLERKSVPPHIDHAVLTALEKLPADRFATCSEFAAALVGPPTAGSLYRQKKVAFPLTPLLVIAGLGLASLYFIRGGADPPEIAGSLRRYSITLPDSMPLAVGAGRPALALTPDGSRLVYAARVHGEGLVAVKDLLTDSMRVLPGSTSGSGPVVSPSGEVAGFLVGSSFIAAPLNGGRERRVETVTPVTRGAAWLNDSFVAIATDPNSWLLQIPLRQGRSQGYPRNWVSGGPGTAAGISHAWPELLPGGKALLFVIADDGSPNNWRIVARTLDGSVERVVVEGGSNPRYAASGHIVFVRDGALWGLPFDANRLEVQGDPVRVLSGVLTEPDGFAHYALSRNGTLVYAEGAGWEPSRRIVWLTRTGTLEAAPIPVGMYENVALAPDGRRAALSRIDGNNHDIWVGDLERGTLRRITRHPGEDGAPVWSPDGNKLAIASEQWGDPPKLAIVDLASGGIELAVDTGFKFSAPTAWIRKGQKLFFVSSAVGLGVSESGADISVLEKSVERPWLQTQNNESRAALSPDGSWVAYVSDESGRSEVYVRPIAGSSGHMPVSSSGGTEPRWGRSGQTLYFRRGDQILSAKRRGGASAVLELSTATMAFQLPQSFVTSAGFEGSAWDIDLNERRIVAIEDRKHLSITSLRVVTNWFEDLRHLAPPSRDN